MDDQYGDMSTHYPIIRSIGMFIICALVVLFIVVGLARCSDQITSLIAPFGIETLPSVKQKNAELEALVSELQATNAKLTEDNLKLSNVLKATEESLIQHSKKEQEIKTVIKTVTDTKNKKIASVRDSVNRTREVSKFQIESIHEAYQKVKGK